MTAEMINRQLQRRQKGYGRGGRMIIENDQAVILGGVRYGETTGSPVVIQITNKDWENWIDLMSPDSVPDPERFVTRPRPGHGDLAGGQKYHRQDLRDVLERASARETAARVAASAVAMQLLHQLGIRLISHVVAIGGIWVNERIQDFEILSETAELSPVRCADPRITLEMMRAIDRAAIEGDTLGGVFEVLAVGVPPGLGSYRQWDMRLDGLLAQGLMSIPGIKGVEIGMGFESADLPGTAVHDAIFYHQAKGYYRDTNRAGGIEAGVTNGEPIILRAAMKPIPTLKLPLPSIDMVTLQPDSAQHERSDVCAVPSAAVVAEGMTAFILAQVCLEKFGGDHIADTLDAMQQYLSRLRPSD